MPSDASRNSSRSLSDSVRPFNAASNNFDVSLSLPTAGTALSQAVSAGGGLDGVAAVTFFQLVTTMSSASYQRQVLEAIINQPSLVQPRTERTAWGPARVRAGP